MNVNPWALWIAATAAVLICAEVGYGRRCGKGLHELRDSVTNVVMGVGGISMGLIGRALTIPLSCFLYRHRLFDIDLSERPWLWGTLTVMAEDLCFYWFHRSSHRVAALWAAHEAHHSSPHYNLTTALRLSWTTPLTGIPFWLPLPLLGLSPRWIVAAHGVSLGYQFLLHTRTVETLGPLEWIFNTPSHHRVHHGSNPEYIDRNFGGIFIVWDRLFGTFARETLSPTFGLCGETRGHRPLAIAFGLWRQLLALVFDRNVQHRRRLAALFGPPAQTFAKPAISIGACSAQQSGIPDSKPQAPPTARVRTRGIKPLGLAR